VSIHDVSNFPYNLFHKKHFVFIAKQRWQMICLRDEDNKSQVLIKKQNPFICHS